MRSRYEAWLNNNSLNDIDPDIYVADIAYTQTEMQRETERRGAGNGSFSATPFFDSLGVEISIIIEAYEPRQRQQVLQRVAAWAASGGWLRTSDRPEQRLYVSCDMFPAITSALRWLDNVTMRFTAHDWPYWQDIIPQQADVQAAANTYGEGVLFVTGYFDAPLEFEITAGGALSTLTVAAAGREIELSSLGAVSGDVIKLGYTDDRHIQTITKNSVSILEKRSGADDLLLHPGINNTITVQGDAAITGTLYVRGLTL